MNETDSKNLKKKVVSGTLWLTGLSFIGQTTTWVISIFVIRLLKPEDYGLMAMAGFFIGFLALWQELGLAPAIIQKKEITDSELRRAFGCVLLINTLFLLCMLIFAPFVASFFSEPRIVSILRALSITFPLAALYFLPQALLRRNFEFKRKATIDLLANVLASVTVLGLAYLGYGVWSLVLSMISMNVFKVIAFNVQKKYCYRPSFDFSGMRHFMVFGGHITVTRTLWYFYSQADILIAGRILGKDILGVYAIAMRIASLPIDKLSSIFTQIGLTTFAKIQSDLDAVQKSFLRLVKISNIFSFPLFIGLAIIAPNLIPLVLGDNWAAVIVPIQILCIIMPVRLVSILFPPIITGVGHPEIITKNMATAIIIMPIAFLVGSQWGMMGLCYAWVTTFPVLFIIMAQRVLKILEIPWKEFLIVFVHPVISSIVMIIGLLMLKWYIMNTVSELWAIPIIIIGGGGLYSSTLLFMNRTIVTELKSFFLAR